MTEPSYLSTTRASYDTVAVDYAELLRGELAAKPLDRALLATFAELVIAGGGRPVADIGCGPGRVTAYLHSIGLTSTFGIDLSPGMVKVAQAAYPGLRFEVGTMTELELAGGSLAGAVAWYSTIHTPSDDLLDVFSEFSRVIAPGGWLLLAFQAGHGTRHLDEAYGHALSLDVHHRSPEFVGEMLSLVGFATHTTVLREPEGRERSRHAYVLARKQVSA